MNFLYTIGIYLYWFSINIAAFFNPKAKLFKEGRIALLERIRSEVSPNTGNIIWVHCSSVGEFEQARPIIEWIKIYWPEYKILITFFSPSGYELRKNYDKADWVYYMPIDTPKNAKCFIAAVKPVKAIFIKYEFWYNYLMTLKSNGIETYIVSAIFRPSQIFFKWYGFFFKKMLHCFTTLFVQDKASAELLQGIGISGNVVVSGDTRFDRVDAIASKSKDLPLVKSFAEDAFTMVAGSSWQPDEVIIADVLKNFSKAKVILVPHEIDDAHINSIVELFAKYKIVKYTSLLQEGKSDNELLADEAVVKLLKDSNVLIINTIGMLSSIYKYGNCAYIGGGFGVGIHNILEPATYGLPVVFGPNYHKFKEARDLIKLGGAFPIRADKELYNILTDFVKDKNSIKSAGEISRKYVETNLGATGIVTSYL